MEQSASQELQLERASEPYLGQWRGLVSTTNWEKGRIICQWRAALEEAAAGVSEYSDDAWSRLAGGVTPQHVGRLRRVYDQFGAVFTQYEGLYWSHFHAALDWDDAEMWLEGAIQSDWSVSQMRRKRWETLGRVASHEPQDSEVVECEVDEDHVEPAEDVAAELVPSVERVHHETDDDDSGENSKGTASQTDEQSGISGSERVGKSTSDDAEPIAPVKPFENLAELPADITEAFEVFKLAILHHKLDGWREVTRDDLLASLDALKELALAPSQNDAPA